MIGKINIIGQIGSSFKEDGTVDEKGVELADVIMQVNACEGAESYEILINSPGGFVSDGDKIADYIGSLKNAYTIAGDICASIATKIHLAVPLAFRKKIEGGKYMIHNPWVTVSGNADQLNEAADYIAKTEAGLVSMYVKATGQDKEAIKGLMSLETTLSDEQCKSLNFVASVIPKTELKAVALVSKKPVLTQTQNNLIMTTIKSEVSAGFAKLIAGLGIKPNDKAVAKASVKRVEAKKEDDQKIKAEVLTTDADVQIYTSDPLADFVADPTKEVKVFADADMKTAMADGSYNLKDGSVIVVKAGVLEEVTPVASSDESATVEELQNKIATMETEHLKTVEDLKAEFSTELEAKLDELKGLLGSSYQPKAEAKTILKPNAKVTEPVKSTREKAEERRAGYKGKKGAEKK